MELLVATGNRHKIEEFARILSPLGIKVLPPGDVGLSLDVEESGESFAQNARIKAEAFYKATGKPSVADDSGLCVDALGGRPGVHSARYQGEASSYAVKMAALLGELRDVPDERRTARFVCAICCVMGEGAIIECEEACEGFIAHAPSGDGGFGYDPLFLVDGGSFAALSPAEKDRCSHRGKALRAFARLIQEKGAG